MKYVERCLWDYKANVAMIEVLMARMQELRSVHGHSYEAHSKNGISDPVSDVADKVLALEKKIESRAGKVRPVRHLQKDLSRCIDERRALLRLLRLRYFRHMETDTVKRELGVSGSTLYRRTMELLRIAGSYF